MSHTYNREKLTEAISAAFEGTITPEQQRYLDGWLQEDPARRNIGLQLEDDRLLGENLQRFRSFDTASDWKKVSRTLQHRRRSLYRLSMIAGIALLLSMGWAAYRIAYHFSSIPDSTEIVEIVHGAPRAKLHLEQGGVITLERGIDPGILLADLSIRNVGEALVYEAAPEEQPVSWHCLEVPRGGEYKLVLPDGTEVSLNADSRLSYPNRFEGDERTVKLYGEAYFDVASDSNRPFVVETDKMAIRALGTAFNVKSYPDEYPQTTLVSGRVEVACGREIVTIHPGQQVTRTTDGYTIRDVDIEPVVAWKEQRFVFDDEPLEEVLKKLERWYDIQIVIRNTSLKEVRYTGNIPKYEYIDKVLRKLELAAHVRFSLNGRTLTVEKE